MNSDFKDLLSAFAKAGVRYLIIGGYAVSKHTEPRYTKDLDIWIDNARENAEIVFHVLLQFGAPLQDIPWTISRSRLWFIRLDCRRPGSTF